MRPPACRLNLLFALALSCVLAVTVALSLPAGARAGNGAGKIEPRLQKLVEKKGENERVAIMLRGPDANKLYRKYARHGELLPLIDAVAVDVKVKELDDLAADPEVSFVLADPPVRPQGVVDYSKLATSYIHTDRVQKVWDKNYDGRGIGIVVIDSGVAPVADFSGRLVQVTGPTQSWTNDDLHGHGSLVAGIAAGKSLDGKFIGTAPGSTIYALNVNNPDGVRSSDVIAALQWVHENAHAYNIRVVNLSLGESIPSSYLANPLDLAVERVWASGVVVVVSAGNGGAGLVDYAPANDPLALTVGSTDNKGTRDTSDDVLASFTAVGPTLDGYSKPELLAPGRLIASVLPAGSYLDGQAPTANRIAPGYATISGTSFSAPQVAGAAALLLQRRPDWSPDNVKWALVQKGHSVSGTSLRALDAEDSYNVYMPGRANQGARALVCAPGSLCLPDNGTSTVASVWDSATWNSATWNSVTWNSASWDDPSAVLPEPEPVGDPAAA